MSAGNDIVSLNAINAARTKQYKFYSKILSESENPLYKEFSSAGIPFENFVWLLWSIKESAYKYLQRNNPDVIFTPVKFVVKQLQLPANYIITNFDSQQIEENGFNTILAIAGIVTYGQYTFHSRSLLYNNLIHSVVNNSENFQDNYWGIKLIADNDSEHQSKEVRSFLLERLQRLFKTNDFSISKSQSGLPILLKGTDETTLPVSLTHHEHFVAYSFHTTINI